MENLKQKLEKTLEEHQRESGLHMIGGRERLVARLLKVLIHLSMAREMRIMSPRMKTAAAVDN